MEKLIQYRLIAIDGLDASGKGTQTELLCQYLAGKGKEYTKLSFPEYDMESSALVRMYLRGDFGNDPNDVNPYAASSFFAVDRYASYKLKWQKEYESGRLLIANRYTTANAVHQLSKLKKSEWEYYLDWLDNYEFELLGLPRPQKVLYLCMPPELSLKLLEKRCRETGIKKDIHEKSVEHIQKSYIAALYAAEYLGWTKIDCSIDGKLRTMNDISQDIIKSCGELLE
ncbi:MAG: hypothetical protein A2Y17_11770 [Clostridiales bacterium GWF2_38_85]|nr:MAG: hypothetical protein A2Y17_11770 [Clostridiales bacterium GWF2_38_85]HBL85380.1 thymidylate kinase [Clostridiales bacterium]